MRKIYKKVYEQLVQGQEAAILTYFPNETADLKKASLEIKNEEDCIPDKIKSLIQEGTPSIIEEEGQKIFVEPFYPKERLIVFGGGHIAIPLVKFAANVGFSVTVIDDRPTFANPERFPWADRVICQTFEDCFDMLNLSEYDYVVIITRGHRHDMLCLRKLLSQKETFYLGMIGSKHRVSGVKEIMLEEGFDEARIKRICTPIGLEIGAVTPEEISISILAQIIRRKRLEHGGKQVNNRSEADPDVLKAIAGQGPDTFSVVTVMSTKGSVPRGPGAKMIVYPDRSIIGSIGGGCSEAAVIWDAMSIIGTGGYLIKNIDLTGDVAENEGMVCGGIMEVLIEDFSGIKSTEVL